MVGEEEAVESVSALVARQRRGKIVRAVVALVLLAGVVGGAIFVIRQSESEADAALVVAYDRFVQCMTGEPPPEGTKASTIVRNAQLTQIGRPVTERAEPGELAWPKTCQFPAFALQEAAEAAGEKKDQGLPGAAEQLAKLLKDQKALEMDLSETVDKVFEEAYILGLTAHGADDVEPPPPPSSPMTLADLDGVPALSKKAFALSAIETTPFPNGELELLIDDPALEPGPALCLYKPGDEALRCRALPSKVAGLSPGLRLRSSRDPGATSYVFAGDRGSSGIFAADGDGSPIASVMTYGAHARNDGIVDYLFWDGDEEKVRRGQHGGDDDELLWSPEDIGQNPYYSLGLLWGQLVYRALPEDAVTIDLRARPTGGNDGDVVTVGSLDGASSSTEEEPHVTGCRTDSAMIARVRTYGTEALAFRLGDTWNVPVKAGISDADLTCQDAEAVFTKAQFGRDAGRYTPTLIQSRCTSAGCKETSIGMNDVLQNVVELAPSGPEHLGIAEVAGKVVVVWSPGNQYGLRMKVAPLKQLDAAPNRAWFDDRRGEQGAFEDVSSYFELRVFSTGKIAVLLLSSKAGVHALTIDGEGGMKPLPTKWTTGE